jgi:hypothetical protein
MCQRLFCFAALYLLMFTGCQAPVGSTGGCGPDAGITLGPELTEDNYDQPVPIVGKSTSVSFVFHDGCNDIGVPAGPVTVEVTDSSLSPIPVTLDLEERGADLMVKATFTLPKAGQYHLVAMRENRPGVLQFDTYAVVERAAPSLLDFTLPDVDLASVDTHCVSFDLTDNGTVVCHLADGFWLLRAGQAPERWVAFTAAVYRDSIWVLDQLNALTRYEDDGQNLKPTFGPLSIGASASAKYLTAWEHGVWVADAEEHVTHFDVRGGTVVTTTSELPQGFMFDDRELVLTRPVLAFAVTEAGALLAANTRPPKSTAGPTPNVCSIDLRPPQSVARCYATTGSVIGLDSNGTWTALSSSSPYNYAVAHTPFNAIDGVTVFATLPKSHGPTPIGSSDNRAPTVVSAGYVLLPVRVGNTVEVDAWPRSPTLTRVVDTSAAVFMFDSEAPRQLSVFRR